MPVEQEVSGVSREDQSVPRIEYDWSGLARRMGVADVAELTSEQVDWGLGIFGLDVGTVIWEEKA